jgi:DNA (cytosine-5)-methyltransferase 1
VDLPKRIQKSYMKGSYNSGGGKRGICRRISWDEPSLTLTTSPSQKQTERAHPAENRPFTTREYARIQSFPDDWKFTGGMTSVYRQIGNAVPVTFAEHISRAMMALLKRIRAGEEKHRSSKREVSSSDDSDSDANDSSDDASSSSDSDA